MTSDALRTREGHGAPQGRNVGRPAQAQRRPWTGFAAADSLLIAARSGNSRARANVATIAAIGAFGTLSMLAAGDAEAQSYPLKPVRIVVGFSAGGAADTTARLVGQRLTRDTGQQVVVENRTGASGLIANRLVAAAAPDGYTLVMVSSAAAIMPALRSDLGYDVERDLAPVALAVKSSHVLLSHPSVPVKRLPDLIALARANPGKLSYGSSGIGSANHMAGELLNLLAKVSIKHIPYKGGAENVIAAVSGETELTYGSLVASTAFIRSGKLRALGVTGSQRSALLPQVPTLAEAGLPGYESTAWYGILAPAGVPRTVVSQLNGLIVKAGQSGELKDAYAKQGLDPQPHTPEEFGEYIRAEIAKNVDLVKRANLKPE